MRRRKEADERFGGIEEETAAALKPVFVPTPAARHRCLCRTPLRAPMRTSDLGRYRAGPFNGFLIPPQPMRVLLCCAFSTFVLVCYAVILVPRALHGECTPLLVGMIITVMGNLVVCDLMLLWTATKEPGILPRCVSAPEDAEAHRRKQGKYPRARSGRAGEPKYIYFCSTCLRWIPMRGHHCRISDVCVRNFDHHCAFTGCCIGERNYPHFLCSAMVSALVGVNSDICILRFLSEMARSSRAKSLGGYIASAIEHTGPARFAVLVLLLFLGTVFFLSFGGLLVYHWGLLRDNVTTLEKVHKTWEQDPARPNPFPKRSVGDVWRYLLQRKPESEIWKDYAPVGP